MCETIFFASFTHPPYFSYTAHFCLFLLKFMFLLFLRFFSFRAWILIVLFIGKSLLLFWVDSSFIPLQTRLCMCFVTLHSCFIFSFVLGNSSQSDAFCAFQFVCFWLFSLHSSMLAFLEIQSQIWHKKTHKAPKTTNMIQFQTYFILIFFFLFSFFRYLYVFVTHCLLLYFSVFVGNFLRHLFLFLFVKSETSNKKH